MFLLSNVSEKKVFKPSTEKTVEHENSAKDPYKQEKLHFFVENLKIVWASSNFP